MAQETRVVDGRKHTVHRVEAGQTLYAISRAYAVPVEALLAANPGARDGLSIGQELLVPQDAVVRKEARTAPTLLRDGELQHVAAKRETLYGIAQKYGVDVNDLLRRNPELEAGLKEGTVVIVPMVRVQGQSEVATRPAAQENFVDHVVKPGETLYSLGQSYNVAPERIRAANNGLPEGLKAGETIRVPAAAGTVAPRPVRADSMVATHRQSYRVGLLLPFATARNDSALAQVTDGPATGSGQRYHPATLIAAQFYAGASMALDSLRMLGLNAEVSVLDLGDEPSTWNAALRTPAVKELDLCIGPFHRSAIEQLARVNGRAHIVCPVPQTNKVVLGQPRVSKVTATRPDLIRHTARYVAQRHAKDNILLLRPDLAADKDPQAQMANALREALTAQPSRARDSALVARPGRRDLGDLPGKLSADRLNVLVATSEDVEFVTSLVGKLKSLAQKYRIVLVGTEGWLGLETVAVGDLDQLGFMFAAGSFVDYEDPRVLAFVKAFRERYGNDADEYAFLGFDVTFYYVRALMAHGTGFPERFQQVRTEPLHIGFRMSRAGQENGFRNEYAVMLQQKDMRLVKAP